MATARRQLGYVSSLTTQTSFITGVYGVATGGTSDARTIGGVDYTVLTFSSDDDLVVTQAGVFDVLLIGGGGGGAGSTSDSGNNAGGGGGAGALIGFAETTTVYLEAATYAIDVGAGGAGEASGTSSGTDGLPSNILNIISAAGGGRAGGNTSGGANGNAQRGGSGGGNSINFTATAVDGLFGNSGGTGTAAGSGGGGGYARLAEVLGEQ
jgi:hypothetical protein